MSTLLFKSILIALILVSAMTQLPNDGFGNYQQQNCCPQGYNVAQGVYCVKCNAPKFWNPIMQRCVTCDPGHTWDPVAHECTCCEAPRRQIGNDCLCPPPKTQWNDLSKTCSCPLNTFGENCIPCPPPRQWNPSTNSCDCPPPTNVWNGATCVCPVGRYGPSCVECPAPRYWNTQTNQCVCNQPFVWSGTECICPQPYFLYQGRCASCPTGFIF